MFYKFDKHHIEKKLFEKESPEGLVKGSMNEFSEGSAVLILLGPHPDDDRPCLILTKRSQKVMQAGDLCCPGGRFSSVKDTAISKVLTLPGFPMAKWPFLTNWRKEYPKAFDVMALFFSTCLRESLEEMFLNPFFLHFLGPLNPFSFELTARPVYPMAGWTCQKKFRTNWEVESLVYIPMENFIGPSNYGWCQLQIQGEAARVLHQMDAVLPCFVHRGRHGTELLWGITYRIVIRFIEIISGFIPPDSPSLPIFYKYIDKNYMT